MTTEFYGECESEEKIETKEHDLLEVMDICSNLYLTHLLAEEIMGYKCPHFAGLGESPWIISILSFEEQNFFKLKRIH